MPCQVVTKRNVDSGEEEVHDSARGLTSEGEHERVREDTCITTMTVLYLPFPSPSSSLKWSGSKERAFFSLNKQSVFPSTNETEWKLKSLITPSLQLSSCLCSYCLSFCLYEYIHSENLSPFSPPLPVLEWWINQLNYAVRWTTTRRMRGREKETDNTAELRGRENSFYVFLRSIFFFISLSLVNSIRERIDGPLVFQSLSMYMQNQSQSFVSIQ